jgi:hypothetical protein
MKASRRMTAAEFDAVRPLLKISEDRISAARAVLVDGQTLQGTATRFGWASRNTVFECVNAVWKASEKYRAAQAAAARAATLLPPGWEQVTLIAPSALIARFRLEIAEAAKQGDTMPPAKRRSKRVVQK